MKSDTSMLEQLYNTYENKMYGIAFSILKSNEQSEDAVHDAFVKLIPHMGDIEEINSVKTKKLIVYTIKNISIDIYRKNKKLNKLFENGDELLFSKNDDIANSIQAIENKEIIKSLVLKLPDKYREIIRYRCYYELTYREISDLLSISEKVAAKRYERAVSKLKELYNKEIIGDELYG